MIAVLAKLNVKQGKESQFEKAMLGLAEQVRANEPGNRLYTLVKDEEGNYLVMELYDDADALKAHGQSEHFKASGASFKGLMGGPPEVKRILRGYNALNESARKNRMERLASLENGAGVDALCRLVRFETSNLLSKRAALFTEALGLRVRVVR